MREIRDRWQNGGKAEKAGFVLGGVFAGAFWIWLIVQAWKTNLFLDLGKGLLGIVVVAVAGLASFILLGIVCSIIYGAIKGAVNEVKKFLKELRG